MFRNFFTLFIIVPLVELMLLIKVGQYLGVWNTIALVVITALLGAFFMRLEGLRVWYNFQQELLSGSMPADKIFDGVLILVGGIVLLTPGIITDIIGFTLLIPWTRVFYKKWLQNKFKNKKRTKANVIEIKELKK